MLGQLLTETSFHLGHVRASCKGVLSRLCKAACTCPYHRTERCWYSVHSKLLVVQAHLCTVMCVSSPIPVSNGILTRLPYYARCSEVPRLPSIFFWCLQTAGATMSFGVRMLRHCIRCKDVAIITWDVR